MSPKEKWESLTKTRPEDEKTLAPLVQPKRQPEPKSPEPGEKPRDQVSKDNTIEKQQVGVPVEVVADKQQIGFPVQQVVIDRPVEQVQPVVNTYHYHYHYHYDYGMHFHPRVGDLEIGPRIEPGAIG